MSFCRRANLYVQTSLRGKWSRVPEIMSLGFVIWENAYYSLEATTSYYTVLHCLTVGIPTLTNAPSRLHEYTLSAMHINHATKLRLYFRDIYQKVSNFSFIFDLLFSFVDFVVFIFILSINGGIKKSNRILTIEMKKSQVQTKTFFFGSSLV